MGAKTSPAFLALSRPFRAETGPCFSVVLCIHIYTVADVYRAHTHTHRTIMYMYTRAGLLYMNAVSVPKKNKVVFPRSVFIHTEEYSVDSDGLLQQSWRVRSTRRDSVWAASWTSCSMPSWKEAIESDVELHCLSTVVQ
jgi:hypothetical protein